MIINARGTKIEIDNDSTIVKLSPVLRTFLTTQMNANNTENVYKLNYRDADVHDLIDFLENLSDREILNNKTLKLMDELLIQAENIKFGISKETFLKYVENFAYFCDGSDHVKLNREYILIALCNYGYANMLYNNFLINTFPICVVINYHSENNEITCNLIDEYLNNFTVRHYVGDYNNLSSICVNEKHKIQFGDGSETSQIIPSYCEFINELKNAKKSSDSIINNLINEIKLVATKNDYFGDQNNNADNVFYSFSCDEKKSELSEFFLKEIIKKYKN